MTLIRTRWAAIGAAVAVTLGGGGIGLVSATTGSGARPVYVPIEPCRLADTRPDTIGPDATTTFDGWGTTGDCSLPTGTSGLALNVTAVDATAQTNLRFLPEGADVPGTANLNPTPGASPTPNAVNVTLNDTSGKFSVYNRFGNVAVIIDVMGYYDDHTHDDLYYTKAQVDTRTPRSQFISVGSSSFGARLDSTVNRTVLGGGASIVGGPQDSGLAAPLHLPHGARIVSATASFVDDSDEDLRLLVSCEFALGGFRTLWEATTTGADAFRRQIEMGQVRDDPVDNTTCAYTVIAFNSRWSTVGDDLAIQHVLVEVELPG